MRNICRSEAFTGPKTIGHKVDAYFSETLIAKETQGAGINGAEMNESFFLKASTVTGEHENLTHVFSLTCPECTSAF